MGQIRKLQKLVHDNAVAKGFYDTGRNSGEILALIHSEVSEALEAIRSTDPEKNNIGEEMADTVIRVMDACEYWGIDLENEILNKMETNSKRPKKHGKKF
jgi:NTP pyrophosphatase (non-canonical NTP hydrolase)